MADIKWTEGATKDLERLDRPVARRILKRLAWFSKNFQTLVPESLCGQLGETFKFGIGDEQFILWKIRQSGFSS